MRDDVRAWRVSSFSGANNACVELAVGSAETAVRDSKNRGGAVLSFGASAWSAFLERSKR